MEGFLILQAINKLRLMKTQFLRISPVLPSRDVERDVNWYHTKVGFELIHKDKLYAVLKRENLSIHLQWHADTKDDPLPGGSVIKIFVNNIQPICQELIERGTINPDKLILGTPWGTNEFGFYDLNRNAIFFVENI